jgi:hypothetical protein
MKQDVKVDFQLATMEEPLSHFIVSTQLLFQLTELRLRQLPEHRHDD